MRATRAFVSTNEPLPAACALDAAPALPLREVAVAVCPAEGSLPVLPCRHPIISTERPLLPAPAAAWLFEPSCCADIVAEQLSAMASAALASAAPVHV
jgi:hypothetical protein